MNLGMARVRRSFLGSNPLTSLNRSFLPLTEVSDGQNVTVPLSTRTNRRSMRSWSAARSGRKHTQGAC